MSLESEPPNLRPRHRPTRVFLTVFLPLAAFYLLVPYPGVVGTAPHIDPSTNAVTAWHLGMKGTVVLEGFESATTSDYFRNIGWYVDSPRGTVSQYPPGAAAVAAPFYLLASDPAQMTTIVGTNRPGVPAITVPMPSLKPAAVAASLSVAAAMGFVAVAVLNASGIAGLAIGAGLVGGVATPMWPVAASALWQHGPAAMWVALAVVMASRSRYVWSGLAFGAAVLTRPHLALVAALVGIVISLAQRRWRPMVLVGLGSSLGVVTLLLFNHWLWGRATVTGGYSSAVVDQLGDENILGFLQNAVGSLFDPRVGLLIVSPFLVPLLFRVRSAWHDAPTWTKGAAVGGAVYLLVQLKANRYTGGTGFVGYRYPLEALTASAPLLALAYPHWVNGQRLARVLFWALVTVAVVRFLLWG